MNDSGRGQAPDRRVRRTRAAIVSAFNRLVLERGYAAITPGEVAEAADVGRSTFYEHFRGLDDLLYQAITPVLAPLAEGCLEPSAPAAVERTIAHVWENRRSARVLLSDETYDLVLRAFAGLFVQALTRDAGLRGRNAPWLDLELIGLLLAAGQLAVLRAWLSGRYGRTAAEVAQALHASGRASALALLSTPRPDAGS